MENTIVPNEDINEILKNYEKKKKNYKTNPKLSKYEKTRVLSERTSQLIDGSIAFIENPESYPNLYQIALKELEEGRIPFIIKRPYSNTFEYWKLSDLL
jgi:DNA-directed RNA polymerase subunit K/omega